LAPEAGARWTLVFIAKNFKGNPASCRAMKRLASLIDAQHNLAFETQAT
jgi:hypothetical protein